MHSRVMALVEVAREWPISLSLLGRLLGSLDRKFRPGALANEEVLKRSIPHGTSFLILRFTIIYKLHQLCEEITSACA